MKNFLGNISAFCLLMAVLILPGSAFAGAGERSLTTFLSADSVVVIDSVVVPDSSYIVTDSLYLDSLDSLVFESMILDSLELESLFLLSLDSTAVGVNDSIIADSLADSTAAKVLTEKELRKLRRDSIRHVRDSIRLAKPRVLRSVFVPDSLYYEELFSWHTGDYTNSFHRVHIDTTFNDWYCEYPYFREDVDVTSLGVAGSAVMNRDFFKRREYYQFKDFDSYMVYSHTPGTIPFYNTKSPYTELAYWGTLFAYKDKEEMNLRFHHTQNITPALNLALKIERWQSAGDLVNEKTATSSISVTGNYLGENYIAQAGYINLTVDRNENGGVKDITLVRDTTIDGKTVPVFFANSSNKLRKNTFFLNHSYSISLSGKSSAKADTVALLPGQYPPGQLPGQNPPGQLPGQNPPGQTPAGKKPGQAPMGQMPGQMPGQKPGKNPNVPMTVDSAALKDFYSLGKGPMLTFGHMAEVSRYYRLYRDNIPLSDTDGRAFYNNNFYINPQISSDSTRMLTVENKVYASLQPWAPDAIVSNITAGVAHQYNGYYLFNPNFFLLNDKSIVQHNFYMYAGASGIFRKYLSWGAFAKYNFSGYNANDLLLDGNIAVSFYPFKKKDEPVTLKGRFYTSLQEPDLFSQRYYSNHYKWQNDFGKTSLTRIEAALEIPKWKMNVSFGYALVNNYLYNDTLGIIRQNDALLNVMSLNLQKDFKLWLFHLDHRLLFQYSSDSNVLPVPLLTTHFRYYIEFVAVPNALTIQIGADATYNTAYYAPAWNPALNRFQLQNEEKVGNNPYIDVFVNLQWKRASIFLKFVNVAQGWPGGDTFSAYRYIRPYRTFKFGIHWPFYIR